MIVRYVGIFLMTLLAIGVGPLSANDITLRLVRAEAPKELVSTVITNIDLEAEKARLKAEAEKAAAAARLAGQQPPAVKDIEVAPKANFDRYVNYMRGIVIDGKHPFYRSYKGSFLGRSDVIKLKLADGEHVIDPGGHRFTVKNGVVTSKSPHLRGEGKVINVILYPVTIIAVDGNTVRDLPAEARRLPVRPQIFWGKEMLLPREKALAEDATFQRLTLYMMANDKGAGYRLSPSEVAFHLGAQGIELKTKGNGDVSDFGISIEDRFSIVVPKFAVPVTVRGRKLNVLIRGAAGRLKLTSPGDKDLEARFYAFPAPDGAEILAGRRIQSQPLKFIGDLGRFPRRQILIDAMHPDSREPRLLLTNVAGFDAETGSTIQVRVQVRDALDADTLSPMQVAVYCWRQPVLRTDGLLADPPPVGAPAAAWLPLRVLATNEPDVYRVQIPQLANSIYRFRVVAGRRGEVSPDASLQADYVYGVINPKARKSLSLFTPAGRRGFIQGAQLPFSVVLKSADPTPAGKLRVTLRGKDHVIVVQELAIPAAKPGRQARHFILAPEAVAVLPEGDYQLQAEFAGISSNLWPLSLRQARWRDKFVYFDHGWGGGNVDQGTKYLNIAPSIAKANVKRRRMQRNAQVLGQQADLNLSDWSSFKNFNYYQGRDSSSEVIQVEMILRRNLSLPAPEVYYYPNHLELTHDSLAQQGMAELNNSHCPFSPRSLIHSVDAEVAARMRHFQLIGQITRKFDNFLGMALVKDDTAPIGDSEVGDQGRTVRLREQRRKFIEKHGFEPAKGGDAGDFFKAVVAGGKISKEMAEAAHRWESWARDENLLLSDFYKMARDHVEPLHPSLRYTIQGPSWGSVWQGSYPVTAHRYQSPLTVQVGSGDYGMMFILLPLLRTRYFQMTGQELWGVQGFHGNMGFYNLKQHFAGFIAAGAKGYGFYNGTSKESKDPRFVYHQHIREERRDLANLVKVYGNLFRQMTPTAEIGVLFPFHQETYSVLNPDLGKGPMPGIADTIFSAMGQLAFLGYNSDVLTEEAIEAGALKQYRVVIAPVLHYLKPRHRQALDKFSRDGGVLLLGSRSTLVPGKARKIDDDFIECSIAQSTWSFNALMDDGHAWLLGEMRRKAQTLRRELAPILQPFARPTTDRCLVQTSRAGQARYTIVWDCLYPSWMGTGRVSPGNASWSAYGAEANESTLMPLKETLDFQKGWTTYELFSQQQLGKPGPEGRTRITADLSSTPFRIFVSLRKPISSLKVEAPATVPAGRNFTVRVTALTADGKPVDGSVPFEIALLNARGQVVSETWPAGSPIAATRFAVAPWEQAGAWQLRVREMISGRQVTVPVAISKAAASNLTRQVRELPRVHVEREKLVREFLAARRRDQAPVLVLLQESQTARYAKLAETLIAELRKIGVKAQLKDVGADGVHENRERVHLYRNWSDMKPARYIDKHVVLIGGEGENALVEDIQENQLLDRAMTANYPGPGRAIISLVRSAFAINKDVLCLFAPDLAGAAQAVATLGSLATPAPDQDAARPQMLPLKSQVQTGRVAAGTPFATMDGNPVQMVSVQGNRIAFGVLGYARNLFVFDTAGNMQYEDKIGHVNTTGITLLPQAKACVVNADRWTYLRDAEGKLKWRAHDLLHADHRGRYLIARLGHGLAVYDFQLKPLWAFDDWAQYETSKDILFARQTTFLGAFDNGDTIAYRLAGKAPGIGGTHDDAILFVDAFTGKEKRRFQVAPLSRLAEAAGLPAKVNLRRLYVLRNGDRIIIEFGLGQHNRSAGYVLFDAQGKVLARETLEAPEYVLGIQTKSMWQLLDDDRLAFVVGDTLCLSNRKWDRAKSVRTGELILSWAIDSSRKRFYISNYDGVVNAYDFDLREIWSVPVGSAGHLALADGAKLAVGTLRGRAMMLDGNGEIPWSKSVNRYAEPEEVEKRWQQLEALPTLRRPGDESPWERIAANVDLGKDVLKLKGQLRDRKPLAASCKGEAFGTYVVEWRHRRTGGSGSVSLRIDEIEALDGGLTRTIRRLSISAQPQAGESLRQSLLRLGDRPQQIRVTVTPVAGLEAEVAVALRPLNFPSKNLIRFDGLYRGRMTEKVRANPPVKLEMFINVGETSSGFFTTRRADSYALVNGRMFESEPGLLNGRWFGSGNFFMTDTFESIPCWVELTLPRKQVVSHIVIAENPSLKRVDTLSVDAYVETRENRKNLSDYEKRQVQRGFWLNVARDRDNRRFYNVYKLKKPVFTRRLRVYVLAGSSSISEIEVYGALPEYLRKKARREP